MGKAIKRSDLYQVDTSWQKWVMCEYCGFKMCVNNYPDRKSRTPKFFGLPICPRCDPRALNERWDRKPRIIFPVKYRTCVCVVLVRKLMQQHPDFSPEESAEIAAKALKFFDFKGNPVDQPEMTNEADRKIYGKVQVQD